MTSPDWSLVTYADTETRQDNAGNFTGLYVSPGRDYVIAFNHFVQYPDPSYTYGGSGFKVVPWSDRQQVYDTTNLSDWTTIFERDGDPDGSCMWPLMGPDAIYVSVFYSSPGYHVDLWKYAYSGSGWVLVGDTGIPSTAYTVGSMYMGNLWDPCKKIAYFLGRTNSSLGSTYGGREIYRADLSTGEFTNLTGPFDGRRYNVMPVLDGVGNIWLTSYYSGSMTCIIHCLEQATGSLLSYTTAYNGVMYRSCFPVPEGGVAVDIATSSPYFNPRRFYLDGGAIAEEHYTPFEMPPDTPTFFAAYQAWEDGGYTGEFLGVDPYRRQFEDVGSWTDGNRFFFSASNYPLTDYGSGLGDGFAPYALFELTQFPACPITGALYVGSITIS